MKFLGDDTRTIFLGQSVCYSGTGMYNSLLEIPLEKKYEMPVAENMQMGISLGLSLLGKIPVSIYPRWNFLISATDQIVNHLDKFPLMANWVFPPKVIIRVAIGSKYPLDPQDQHRGDFTEAFRSMCKTIKVIKLEDPRDIFPMYKEAACSKNSTILVENADLYGLKID